MEDKIVKQLWGDDRDIFPKESLAESIKLYELYVLSAQEVSKQRERMNTFYLSISSTIFGLVVLALSSGGDDKSGAIFSNSLSTSSLVGLCLLGGLLSVNWLSLLNAYRNLNTGKFAVIHELEKKLPAACYAAEWEALDRGEDPRKYVKFTVLERRVPLMFFAAFFGVLTVFALSKICS